MQRCAADSPLAGTDRDGEQRREANAAASQKLAQTHRCVACDQELPGCGFSRKMLTRPPLRRRCIQCSGGSASSTAAPTKTADVEVKPAAKKRRTALGGQRVEGSADLEAQSSDPKRKMCSNLDQAPIAIKKRKVAAGKLMTSDVGSMDSMPVSRGDVLTIDGGSAAMRALRRVCLFASTGRLGHVDGDLTTDDELASQLTKRLQSLGLPGTKVQGAVKARRLVKAHVRRCFEKRKMNVQRLFRRKCDAKLKGAPRRLVKLEICAGSGEWITHQCRRDPSVDWCALELRHNRCASIFGRGVLAGVENLGVLGGDATVIVRDHLSPRSFDHIFINFPEPPQNHDYGREDGDHLLDATFFRNLHAILRPDCGVTVVTDNLPYAKIIAETVLGVQNQADGTTPIFREALNGGANSTEHGGARRLSRGLWSGTPPGFEADGCSDSHRDGGSYFDRLWSRRSKCKRFFVAAVRTGCERSTSEGERRA